MAEAPRSRGVPGADAEAESASDQSLPPVPVPPTPTASLPLKGAIMLLSESSGGKLPLLLPAALFTLASLRLTKGSAMLGKGEGELYAELYAASKKAWIGPGSSESELEEPEE